MRQFVKVYNFIMSVLGMLCLVGFVGSVLIQVFSRTFLPKTPSWTEEAARYLFIFMVAFGSSVAVRTKEFVGIDMITNFFSESVNKALELIIYIVLFGFSTYILTKSVAIFAFPRFRMISTAMQIPMRYVYTSLIILFGFLAFSFLIEIILLLTGTTIEKEVIE